MRSQQKNFFIDSDFEFEQDQRILDWADHTKPTFTNDPYFSSMPYADIKHAQQAIIIIRPLTNIKDLVLFLESLTTIPRIVIAINKFHVYTDESLNVSEDYDTALLEIVSNVFKNRKIEYFFVPKVRGLHFNFSSPTTQFFIT